MKENTESHRQGLGKKETTLLSVLSRENKPIFTANEEHFPLVVFLLKLTLIAI